VSLLLANLPRAVVLIAALAVGWGWILESRRSPSAAVAFDAREARALCRSEKYPEEYFWERFFTMGGRIAVLRSERLGRFLDSGRAIRFTREEIERMRAAGAADAAAPLSPNAVWTEDAVLASRFQRGAEASGSRVDRKQHKGRHVLSLPAGTGSTAGFDEARAARLRAKGLTPAYALRTPADLRLALDSAEPAVFWVESGWEDWEGEDWDRLADRLSGGKSWLAWADSRSDRALLPGRNRKDSIVERDALFERIGVGRVRRAGRLSFDAGAAAAIFAVRAERIVSFDASLAVEETLDRWRSRFRAFRRAGLAAGPAGGREYWAVESAWIRALRRGLGALVLILGPLAALRAGRSVLAKGGHWVLAFSSAAVAACFWGLLGRWGASAYDLLVSPSYRSAEPLWAFLVMTLAVGGVRSASNRRNAGYAAAAVGAGLLWALPQTSFAAGDWLGRRWLEVLIGAPALLAGLRFAAAEEREWSKILVFIGILTLIALVQTVSDARIPVSVALSQALAGALAGGVLGGLVLGVCGVSKSR
jgi:hypothetical protein